MDINKFIENIIQEEIESQSKMAVNEKLKGKQKKLDKNKNNKIDAEDFKMLRGETKEGKSEKDGKWIQKAVKRPGALHKALGIPEGEKISKSLLNKKKKELSAKGAGDKKLSASDNRLLKQINFALNAGSLNESKPSKLILKESELIDLIEEIVLEAQGNTNKPKHLKENSPSKLILKESELIDLIEEIVLEVQDKAPKPEGLKVTEKSLGMSKDENKKALAQTAKKMKDYVGDMYEEEPKSFPKANGGDKMKYEPSDAVEEYVDNFAYAGGLDDLDYDEIEPNEEWVSDNIKGSSRTGNNSEWANAEETDLGEKILKRRKLDPFNTEKKKSYKRVSQPVDTAGKDKKSGTLDSMFAKLESIKEDPIIKEEMEKMMRLINY